MRVVFYHLLSFSWAETQLVISKNSSPRRLSVSDCEGRASGLFAGQGPSRRKVLEVIVFSDIVATMAFVIAVGLGQGRTVGSGREGPGEDGESLGGIISHLGGTWNCPQSIQSRILSGVLDGSEMGGKGSRNLYAGQSECSVIRLLVLYKSYRVWCHFYLVGFLPLFTGRHYTPCCCGGAGTKEDVGLWKGGVRMKTG